MNIIDRVLRHALLADAPPVLVDVGASSGVHRAWRALAKYSICIAFDADGRGMAGVRRESRDYRELYVYDRVLTTDNRAAADFYLTQDAPCSSQLPPNIEAVADWEFASRFSLVRKMTLPAIQLNAVLADHHLDRIDWFKTDSQGTDLRLFLSLDPSVADRVLVAEFEPGILEAYHGDDKLGPLLTAMHERGFWMSGMNVLGSGRINKDTAAQSGMTQFERRYLLHLLKTSPGWAEVVYRNSFLSPALREREFLLGWVCAHIGGEHGFALELAARGQARFGELIFTELERTSLSAIRRGYWNLPRYAPLALRALRRWKRLGFRWQHPGERAPQSVPVKQLSSNNL
jgi:hypothetical protein